MNSKLEAMRSRLEGARSKGGKAVWYMVFANAIADRLCETDAITRDDMKSIFKRRLQDAKGTPEEHLLVPAYEECLARLDEFRLQTRSENGYEATGQ